MNLFTDFALDVKVLMTFNQFFKYNIVFPNICIFSCMWGCCFFPVQLITLTIIPTGFEGMRKRIGNYFSE